MQQMIRHDKPRSPIVDADQIVMPRIGIRSTGTIEEHDGNARLVERLHNLVINVTNYWRAADWRKEHAGNVSVDVLSAELQRAIFTAVTSARGASVGGCTTAQQRVFACELRAHHAAKNRFVNVSFAEVGDQQTKRISACVARPTDEASRARAPRNDSRRLQITKCASNSDARMAKPFDKRCLAGQALTVLPTAILDFAKQCCEDFVVLTGSSANRGHGHRVWVME